MFKISALYIFSPVHNTENLRHALHHICSSNNILGTLLIATEGLNGTVAGTHEAIDTLLHFLRQEDMFPTIQSTLSYAEKMPFHRMKIRIKNEIVTMGIPDISPYEQTGTYISPEAWNDILNDPEMLVIDTRNDYEVRIGTFKGAIHPETQNFSQFPAFVEKSLNPQIHKKIAMFCTGGIRCEKSTAYLKKKGFENVYHLKGGILKYLQNIPQEKSLWQGECFIFDDRTALDHQLQSSTYMFCRGCRHVITTADTEHAHYLEGVHCAYCFAHLTDHKKNASMERHRQILLAKKRGSIHLGSRNNAQNA